MLLNLKSNQFENQLYDIINNSGLPIANVYFILTSVQQEAEKFYKIQIQKEKEELILQQQQQQRLKQTSEQIEKENNDEEE